MIDETLVGGDAARGVASPPYLSLSEITLPDTSFAEDVALCRDAGIAGLGIWEYKLERMPVDEAVTLLDAAALRRANCVPVGNSIFPYSLSPEPAEPHERVEALRRRLARLAPLRPESVVVITGPAPGGDVDRAREVCRAAFEALAVTAADEGLRLALEPMHPDHAAELCLFDGIAPATAFLDELDAPALGLLLDSWHVAAEPDLPAAVHAVADRIFGVHLADHRAGATRWEDRALPGEGGGEALRLVELLREVGFSGALDVEIFSDDGRYGERVDGSLWELSPAEIVARCARFGQALAL